MDSKPIDPVLAEQRRQNAAAKEAETARLQARAPDGCRRAALRANAIQRLTRSPNAGGPRRARA
jgi:hypothetical protein